MSAQYLLDLVAFYPLTNVFRSQGLDERWPHNAPCDIGVSISNLFPMSPIVTLSTFEGGKNADNGDKRLHGIAESRFLIADRLRRWLVLSRHEIGKQKS